MNDLALSPGMVQDVLARIHCLESVERVFLPGQGLSPSTYRFYLEAVTA